MARSIARGHGQRARAGIGGQHLRLGPFAGQRQGDRAGASAEVGQLQRLVWRQPLQRQLDQQLGFRTRDQRGRVDLQVQRPETAAAGQVGHRLTGHAAGQQRFEGGQVGGGQRIGGMREQPAARALQHMQQQQFGLVAGLDAAEAGTGLGHDLAQGGFGLGKHAAIVERSPCSAASGAVELHIHRSAVEHGSTLQKAAIRSGSARGDKEGLLALFSRSGRFPLSHSQLQDGSGKVQCLLMTK